jgi:hypothetical protein
MVVVMEWLLVAPAEIERFRAVTQTNPQNYGINSLVKQITTNLAHLKSL